MSSWVPSWFSFPKFDVSIFPNLQRKFFSFILKRFLGHLLKPGQLDVEQIDSAIGSGNLTINDLKLECTSINALLSGLPVQLHEGSIASVSARLPWPNPLTNGVELSVRSLNLTFHLLPRVAKEVSLTPTNLADSISDAAELFAHEEITREESTEVYQAFQNSRAPRSNKGDDYVPGGLDTSRDDPEVYPDVDPTGISMFASMFEYLLSQFAFSAKDINITIIHPGHSSFRFKVAELRYGKPTAGHGEMTRTIEISGVEIAHRDLSILGSPVSRHSESGSLSSIRQEFDAASPQVGNMAIASSSPAASLSSPTPSSLRRRSGSNDFAPSVDSSVPEHCSRPSSPSGSTASSLFQSALTTQGSGRELRSFEGTAAHLQEAGGVDTVADQGSCTAGDCPLSPAVDPINDEPFHRVIVSLITEPIAIHITTSTPPVPQNQTNPASHTAEPGTSHPDPLHPNLEISVSAGVVACALTASQIGAILDIISVIGSHSGQSTKHSMSKNAGPVAPSLSLLDQASLTLRIRGLVLLLQSVPASLTTSFEDAHDGPLSNFFAHPLTPPKTNHSYIRFVMDMLEADFSVSTTLEQLTNESGSVLGRLPERSRVPQGVRGVTLSQLRFSIGDLSTCAFCIPNHAMVGRTAHDPFVVLPILLTDPFLHTQYSPEHHPPPTVERHSDISPEYIRKPFPPLPEFEILDWTSEDHRTSHAKLSLWRVKPPPGYRRTHRSHPGDSPVSPHMPSSPKAMAEELSTNKPQSALSGEMLLSSPKDPSTGTDPELKSACSVHVTIIPLHVFVDMRGMAAVLDFLDIVSIRHSSRGSAMTSSRSSDSGSEGEDHKGTHKYADSGDLTPLSSPQREALERINQRELEDLDLSVDYLSSVSTPKRLSPKLRKRHGHTQGSSRRDSVTEFEVNCVMIRIQLRSPSPPSLAQRSGVVILDVHGLSLTSRLPLEHREMYPHRPDLKTQSTSPNSSSRDNHLLWAEWRALLIACSSAGAATARVFCSVGPLFSEESEVPSSEEHIRFPDDTSPIRRFACMKLAQNPPLPSGRKGKRSGVFVAEINVPSMYLNLTKPLFDSVQFWIDDVSQLLEQNLVPSSDGTRENSSRNPSLVGSRFFSNSKQGSVDTAVDNASSDHSKSLTERILKVTISEAAMRLLIPHEIEGATGAVEPFDIFVSDVDVLLESKPEGKDDTVITLSIMGITVLDAVNPFPYPMLSLAAPRRLFSTPKPMVKLRFASMVLHETTSKESRIKLSLLGFILNVFPDMRRIDSLSSFVRPPPGAFESVVPNERTQIAVKIGEGSVRLFAPKNNGAFVLHLGDFDLKTEIVGDSPEILFNIAGRDLAALFTDNYLEAVQVSSIQTQPDVQGALHWKRLGYALITEVSDLALSIRRSNDVSAQSEAVLDRISIRIHLCADTGSALGLYFGHFGSAFETERVPPTTTSECQPRHPAVVSGHERSSEELTYSIDQHAFRGVPEVGAAPDMIHDDLPSNPDYLDVSFGAAAGLRELNDDDLDMDDTSQSQSIGGTNLPAYSASLISNVGGETIKLLDPKGLQADENFFNTLPALVETSPQLAEELDRVVIREGDITLFLYEGYDWATTRKVIEDELKKMKQRLTRIKQLVASGQAYDPSIDPANALLFNSIHVGLEQDVDEMEPGALIAAIDEQLREDNDAASVSSWQSLRPASSGRPNVQHPRLHGRRLTRSRGPSIEIRLSGLFAQIVKFVPNDEIVSRTFTTIRDVEILDHVKTSTWKKFLTALRSDSRGNIRETGSDMVRIELRSVHSVPGNLSEETRLRVKILPLRLHVDQDALDFLKKFFNFQNPNAPLDSEPRSETYLQRAEVYPVVLKLDYKPRRVDYRALREGRTIELMNFFHFDGAEMTLRHLTLFGVAGWPRFFDMLNDLWTPDVKATQLADVISGVAPIRSVVNVGSGVADLVLLPITQYRKDGRVVRGLQKGTKAFVRSTAMEAIKLGAQLATGTQVILEQAENVLGSGFGETILAETVSHPSEDTPDTVVQGWGSDEESTDLISRYAEQPVDIREGIQSAYTSIRRNLSSAAQTILAVPMEVFERSGSEGPVRAVIRAVPIAVLRPMIGASEAVSKTLLGLHNTMDPEIRHENAAKYKHR